MFFKTVFFSSFVLFKCQLKSSQKNLHSCTLLRDWERDVYHDRCRAEEPLPMPSRLDAVAEIGWETPRSSTSAGFHGTAGPNPTRVVAECSLVALLPRVDEVDDRAESVHSERPGSMLLTQCDCSFSLTLLSLAGRSPALPL